MEKKNLVKIYKFLEYIDNEYILFSRILGVSITLLTLDNKFVFLKRSEKLIEEPGVYDNIGGHPEPSVYIIHII